jgi:hypothetical protein
MRRSGCFEIRMDCPRCGQSVPINGPFRRFYCSSCSECLSIPDETITGFLCDFEEDSPGLSEGQGSGGTMMGGGGTFKYGYWRLAPRCSTCSKSLTLPEFEMETEIVCGCGRAYQVYPAPEWLRDAVPSARQIISREREMTEGDRPGSSICESSDELVVMSCPQCGGALSVGSGNDRTMKCGFCGSEVFIPDAVWARLHPVRKTEEWFVLFEGRTPKQILQEQRRIDTQEQKIAIKKLRPRRLRGLSSTGRFKLTHTILASLLLFPLTAGLMYLAGANAGEIGNVLAGMVSVAAVIGFLAVTIWGTFHMEIAYRWGYAGKCRKAMEELAFTHGWKLNGREHKQYMGSVGGRYRGCSFEIHPDDDYAIEVSLKNSRFYLKTETPDYPPDDMMRFTTGNQSFDQLFPIRYAEPAIVSRLETEQDSLLKPFNRFIERWGDKLAKVRVSRSDLEVHLAPGHRERLGVVVRFIYPGELEPLLEDMITLAIAIDRISEGKEPESQIPAAGPI